MYDIPYTFQRNSWPLSYLQTLHRVLSHLHLSHNKHNCQDLSIGSIGNRKKIKNMKLEKGFLS
tara:strand:+ start:663 stop:851 length:189 start_codon:yes stop_codon:yes gene_type:complete